MEYIDGIKANYFGWNGRWKIRSDYYLYDGGAKSEAATSWHGNKNEKRSKETEFLE